MARPRLHDAALRDRLLDLASREVAAHGEAALSVRSLASAAGTSPSAVYTLFGGRDALLAAVSAEGFARFADHLARAPRTSDAEGDLTALGLAYRSFALTAPHYYAVMFAHGVRPDPAQPDPRAQPTFRALSDAVARIAPDAPRDALADTASTLWGLVHGLVSLELAGLLPGTRAERDARYAAALGAAGPGLLSGGTTNGAGPANRSDAVDGDQEVRPRRPPGRSSGGDATDG
ncbi:TetR/AcrR family transcriptional regulator [Isoptericola jiangsuensis]|uniref:TetR/AcrR family transcriptional regulator n=1 Tax=Isoptericola jiangsuensis TaxID=548579 RepID=UPI003AAD059C